MSVLAVRNILAFVACVIVVTIIYQHEGVATAGLALAGFASGIILARVIQP